MKLTFLMTSLVVLLIGCDGATASLQGGAAGTEGGQPDAVIDASVGTEGAVMDAPSQDVPASDAEPCYVPGAARCPCGKPGQACCAGTKGVAMCSDPGTICGLASGAPFSTCLDCGAPGQPCCATNGCTGGGCCVVEIVDGFSKPACTNAGAACTVSSGGTCGASVAAPGSCGSCGALGQPCCEVVNSKTADRIYGCTAPNTYCTVQSTTGTCEACGAAGQPCCVSGGTGKGAPFGAGCDRGLQCITRSFTSQCEAVTIACDEKSCAAGTHCNAWTGRCNPDGSPLPPPGLDNGEPCTSDTMCRSTGGVGESLVPACLSDNGRFPGGYCVSYCNVPPDGFWSSDVLARSNCPVGSICLPAASMPAGEPFGACVRECRSDDDCRVAEGYYCRRQIGYQGHIFSNGYCAPEHCVSRGCASIRCGC